MARQRTVWLFGYQFKDGRKIRAGYVFNPPAPRDCIRVEIPAWNGKHKGGMGFYMRPDEANAVLAGLAHAIGYGLNREEWETQKHDN